MLSCQELVTGKQSLQPRDPVFGPFLIGSFRGVLDPLQSLRRYLVHLLNIVKTRSVWADRMTINTAIFPIDIYGFLMKFGGTVCDNSCKSISDCSIQVFTLFRENHCLRHIRNGYNSATFVKLGVHIIRKSGGKEFFQTMPGSASCTKHPALPNAAAYEVVVVAKRSALVTASVKFSEAHADAIRLFERYRRRKYAR